VVVRDLAALVGARKRVVGVHAGSRMTPIPFIALPERTAVRADHSGMPKKPPLIDASIKNG
jgi:hypothetical protein